MDSDDTTPGSSPIDEDDIPVPCKGCGSVLEEGKAFELAGNRWHIDCFRCNNCSALLDSDANLLLLGDGSLICNRCTYSCTACGSKIEDLAILTGDQAFCAGCFRCRNCKRKIENLKYARTSQGIFCMNCHESLMARRRKRQKADRKPVASASAAGSPMLSLDKSLPSLPVEEPAPPPPPSLPVTQATTPTLSQPPPPRRNACSYGSGQTSLVALHSPSIDSRSLKRQSQLILPSEDRSLRPDGLDSYTFIPLVLDGSPGPSSSPGPLQNTTYSSRPISGRQNPIDVRQYHDRELENSRSYERVVSGASSHHEGEKERSRLHIASQDRSYESYGEGSLKSGDSGRTPTERLSAPTGTPTYTESKSRSSDDRALDIGVTRTGSTNTDPGTSTFKLGDVPRERRKPASTPMSPQLESTSQEFFDAADGAGLRVDKDGQSAVFSAGSLPRRDSFRPPLRSGSGTPSLVAAPSPVKRTLDSPAGSTPSINLPPQHRSGTPNLSIIPPAESSRTQAYSSKSDRELSNGLSQTTSITMPRPTLSHRPSTASETHSSANSDFNYSETSPTIIAHRSLHARSLSEIAKQSPNWPRSPASGNSILQFGDIGSPISSADFREENLMLKQELRRYTQRIAELEAKLNGNASAKALESNIQEKRKTVAILETERETVLRELMVIKERQEVSKDGQPVSMEDLKSELILGLTRELESLKSTLKSDIQVLITQRDRLMEDVEGFGRMREHAIQETEQLNIKNTQLADLNNELTRRIQSQCRSNKLEQLIGPGLGIYDSTFAEVLADAKDQEKRSLPAPASVTTVGGTPYNESSEASEVFVAQKVSTVKNSAQPKKFFWKKPGASIMKGAGKGFNRVFANENQSMAGSNPPSVDNSLAAGALNKPEGNKIFGNQAKWSKNKGAANGLNAPGEINTGQASIFGSELESRLAVEGVKIPIVVQKCIQEVEVRGMDYEGIYRKSGGATQMRQIIEDFENGSDIQFDPHLDICSVTSVLKQYFRNLPNPLIPFEVYDRFVGTSEIVDEEKRILTMKEIMNDLPQAHRDVLQFTIFHLARVAAKKEHNLMNARNLAVVFAPTLMRHTSDEREISDMHVKNAAIQFLIEFNEAIF